MTLWIQQSRENWEEKRRGEKITLFTCLDAQERKFIWTIQFRDKSGIKKNLFWESGFFLSESPLGAKRNVALGEITSLCFSSFLSTYSLIFLTKQEKIWYLLIFSSPLLNPNKLSMFQNTHALENHKPKEHHLNSAFYSPTGPVAQIWALLLCIT